jgi:electron transfer flavoprotein alpha subunit
VILVVVEHDRGAMSPATWEALAAARQLGEVHALTIGAAADALVDEIAAYGATTVHQAHHEILTDYAPEAWGEVVAQAVRVLNPETVLATGTDRGNEVIAQAAARLDLPMVANVVEFDGAELIRVRWGGSLLERCTLEAPTRLLTVGHHAFAAEESPTAATVAPLAVDLDPSLARTIVRDRVERAAGVTLATAPVVVSGGRGVGSPEGFAPLQELATALGGVVGCSRAVTNNGWRNHTDQVGQTGTRIAPDIYIACGISGAIQHWVGAMASKKILAINTDPEANMVTKADYAVIGDLHKVVPAITEEIRRRRG